MWTRCLLHLYHYAWIKKKKKSHMKNDLLSFGKIILCICCEEDVVYIHPKHKIPPLSFEYFDWFVWEWNKNIRKHYVFKQLKKCNKKKSNTKNIMVILCKIKLHKNLFLPICQIWVDTMLCPSTFPFLHWTK